MNDIGTTQAGGDPLIDEVRAIRQAISEQYGNDVDRLCDHLQELEREHTEWIIAAGPSESPTTSQRLLRQQRQSDGIV